VSGSVVNNRVSTKEHPPETSHDLNIFNHALPPMAKQKRERGIQTNQCGDVYETGTTEAATKPIGRIETMATDARATQSATPANPVAQGRGQRAEKNDPPTVSRPISTQRSASRVFE